MKNSLISTSTSYTDDSRGSNTANSILARRAARRKQSGATSAAEKLLNEKYKVLKSIGKGVFGSVVKAQNVETKEFIAIKINKTTDNFPLFAKQEIKILQSLKNCKHVCPMLESFTSDHKQICIVLPFLGNDLKQEILKRGEGNENGLPLLEIRKIAFEMLLALDALKKRNIIHCDVKPENICFSIETEAKEKVATLIDFGNAFSRDGKRGNGHYVQSRFYRAPEVMLGQEYSFPIDMWSLGCVLIELFLGQPLFFGLDSHDQLFQIIAVLGLPKPGYLEKGNKKEVEKYFLNGKLHSFVLPKETMKPKLIPKQQNGQIMLTRQSLEHIISARTTNRTNFALQNQFLELLKEIFVWDSNKRIRPEHALVLPFFSKPAQDHYIPACRNIQRGVSGQTGHRLPLLPVSDARNSQYLASSLSVPYNCNVSRSAEFSMKKRNSDPSVGCFSASYYPGNTKSLPLRRLDGLGGQAQYYNPSSTFNQISLQEARIQDRFKDLRVNLPRDNTAKAFAASHSISRAQNPHTLASALPYNYAQTPSGNDGRAFPSTGSMYSSTRTARDCSTTSAKSLSSSGQPTPTYSISASYSKQSTDYPFGHSKQQTPRAPLPYARSYSYHQ